jgi:hypothetical protein
VGSRAGLDRCGKTRPHRDSIPGPSSPQLVTIPTELPGSKDKMYRPPIYQSTVALFSPIISLLLFIKFQLKLCRVLELLKTLKRLLSATSDSHYLG